MTEKTKIVWKDGCTTEIITGLIPAYGGPHEGPAYEAFCKQHGLSYCVNPEDVELCDPEIFRKIKSED